MGGTQLGLLLFLCLTVLTNAQDEDVPTCLLAQRYKTLHKYEYLYEAESLNSINGASQLKNGPRVSCKVEIEVPQTCSFIIHTTDCSLSEVETMSEDGSPQFGPAANSEAFRAEMERFPLRVLIEGEYDVKLFPEEEETTTILNFKRGIVSALAVPALQDDKNRKMPTIHGKCKTSYNVNARTDTATDVTLDRDLSRCDMFVPIRDHNSPLALITGMHYPLSKMVSSSQTCNYKFDDEKKHMTSGSCTETHLLIPFSHKGTSGVTNVGMQKLTLVEVSTSNDRVFDHGNNIKYLHMESVEDKSAVQDKEAALALMRELVSLSDTEGERRAHLFQKLVSAVRGMKTETLSSAIPEALDVSRFLTYQVLAQCGTPECSSAIMQVLRTFDKSSLEVDATTFAMGLMANPSPLLINDMLQMAKYKHSKPIFYALSNAVRRYNKNEGKMVPEISAVADFMAAELDDCTGDQDQTFLLLRVIGNMAPAVYPASPALGDALLQCLNQPGASQQIQQASIQVYREIPLPEEARKVFMEILLNKDKPVQQRIAVYLVLMNRPQLMDLAPLNDALANEENQQFKNFVTSHLSNILSSTDPETQGARDKIYGSMGMNYVDSIMNPMKFSRHYKVGSVEGNMIFEESSYLPKEVMLDMTLKAFGFDIDMMEIGMEGTGFEPTVEALFGEDGFFPDTTLKAMFFVSENTPDYVSETLQEIIPALKRNRMKRETSKNLAKEIGHNFEKLMRELKQAESPEAMVYLRLLGNELGYLKTSDLGGMIYSARLMFESMFKMVPRDLIHSLLTNPDTSIFTHYIFMDNEFFLPTITGVPLRVALSGTFAPGFKGGIQIDHSAATLAFMPFAGVEFVTQFGSHIPEYINSGLEMHTNIFQERGVKVKISTESHLVKLTIPAPTEPAILFKMTNTLGAVTAANVNKIPPMVTDMVDVSKCSSAFGGMKICTVLQYTDTSAHATAPYFPLTGDSKFAVELHPTGGVTEYTATVSYELTEEGEQEKVDLLKFVVKAEGAEGTEASAVMKYNRQKNFFTGDILIPDYDVETGIRLGVSNGNLDDKQINGISLDFVNKNIPEITILGRTSLKAMKEGVVKVQLLVPSANTEATFTAKAKNEEKLKLELGCDVKIMDAKSKQKIQLKYDGKQMEVEVKSELNTKTTSLPSGEFFERYGNEVLDMQVGKTDMKVRHIAQKFVEAANNYMEKYGAEVLPYMKNFRLPEFPEVSLPENLYLNSEAKAIYTFNDERFRVVVPVLYGGKSREELSLPPALTIPGLSLPQIGLDFTSRKVPIPDFVVPERFTLFIPYFGKAEVLTSLNSNLYDMEASVAFGKDVVEAPSYSAKFDMKGTSPIDILSVAVEGSGVVATSDSIRAQLKGALTHKFIEANIIIEDSVIITDAVNLKSLNKVAAKSPLGLDVEGEYIFTTELKTEAITSYSRLAGLCQAGPIRGTLISAQTFSLSPFKKEAAIDSQVEFDSSFAKATNTFAAKLDSGEFTVKSSTTAFEDVFVHDAELKFQDKKLAVKCNTIATLLGLKMQNQAEASASPGEVTIRVETSGDHSDNRVYSLLTTSFDENGLAGNCNANVKLLGNEGTHKSTLKMNKDGWITSGTTNLQSPLSLENVFNGRIDATGALLSVSNKAAALDTKVDSDNTLSITSAGIDFNSKVEANAIDQVKYIHEYKLNLKPYTLSANVNNNLKLLAVDFINQAELHAELYKMELTGSLLGTYAGEEIKHAYQVNVEGVNVNAKCSTAGKLFGTQVQHSADFEMAGPAATFKNMARFNSKPVRFDHQLRATVVPFDFNLNSIFNADGDVDLYGSHSAQLYGKFDLRMKPLAFAAYHECRSSVTHKLSNGFSLSTTYDNKMDAVLSSEEQKTSFVMKSKMNEHAFNEDIYAYNTADRIGVEVSGSIFTNVVNTGSDENQEFTLSGFLKYDKNTDSHMISFPFTEALPFFLESFKELVLPPLKAVQEFINKEEVRAKLRSIPQNIINFIHQIDVDGKAAQLWQHLTDFAQNVVISTDELKDAVGNLYIYVDQGLPDLSPYIESLRDVIRDTVQDVIQKVRELLYYLNEKYFIIPTVLDGIEDIRDIIREIDLEALKDSSFEFLLNIKDNIQDILKEVKDIIESISYDDVVLGAETSFKIIASLAKSVVEETQQVIVQCVQRTERILENYDIVGRINRFYAKLKDLAVQFEVDQYVKSVIEKAIEVIQVFKIEETTEKAFKMLEEVAELYNWLFGLTIRGLERIRVEDIVRDLDRLFEGTVVFLQEFNYSDFVMAVNEIMEQSKHYLMHLMEAFEIPQKLKAVQEFINVILSSTQDFAKHLGTTKITDLVESANGVLEIAIWEPLKIFGEDLKKAITDFDVNQVIEPVVSMVTMPYRAMHEIVFCSFTFISRLVDACFPDVEILSELNQIIEGQFRLMKIHKFSVPSFTVPFTDLVVPPWEFNADMLTNYEIPPQFDIPAFTILGSYPVGETTISIEDIKQKINNLIDFFLNFKIQPFGEDSVFGEITLSYLPTLPDIALPEITFNEITFPEMSKISFENFLNELEVPKINPPRVPRQIRIPCFGKLHGEIKLDTPVYTMKTSAEFQNSTEQSVTPLFTGSFSSRGSSPTFEIIDYTVDSTVRIVIPKMKRMVIAETVKLTHAALAFDHQASLTLYGSLTQAQAQAKTTAKVSTTPYTAEFTNTAFIGMERGMTATVETGYKHQVTIPVVEISSQLTATQKLIARQDGFTFSLTGETSADDLFNGQSSNHNSKFDLAISPSMSSLSFSGDTNSPAFQMKQILTAESSTFNYMKFNASHKLQSQTIKNNLLTASGLASLQDFKAMLEAKHQTELYGAETGVITNAVNLRIRPVEFLFDFQNKGNVQLTIVESLTAKIDMQNDYLVTLKPDLQKLTAVFLARLNQYKASSNVRLENNNNDAGLYLSLNSEANLDFLTYPLSIPEIELPFVDFHTPAINDLNLFEAMGLRDILTTTDQAVNTDARVVYLKSKSAPLVSMGPFYIPSVGNLEGELSFKSTVLNLNANAGIFTDEDLVFRLSATTASVLESLIAKLEGTSSLTTKRGFKLSNSVALENRHVQGNHVSTVSVNTETFESAASSDSNAKIDFPFVNFASGQTVAVNLYPKTDVRATFKIKGDFDIPLLKSEGKVTADHTLMLERTPEYFSFDNSLKYNQNGFVFTNLILNGDLDNEAHLYINENHLRSSSKFVSDAKLLYESAKVLSMDLNNNMAIDASMESVHAKLNYVGNNEANVFNFNTNGKHRAVATFDFTPLSSAKADVEIDISQPSSLGEVSYFEKILVDMAPSDQTVSVNAKLVSPLYTTDMGAEFKGSSLSYQATYKSTATSPIVFLEYTMDGSSKIQYENEDVNINQKFVLSHADLSIDADQVITSVPRMKRQAEDSPPYNKLNVRITSPFFADFDFRHMTSESGAVVSFNTLSGDSLTLDVKHFNLCAMNAKLFCRFKSDPDNDVDILVIRPDADTSMKIIYNQEGLKKTLTELKNNLPDIISAFTAFAEKYSIVQGIEAVRYSVMHHIGEVYSAAVSYDVQMSQMSNFFKNTVVQYQKAAQALLDAVIKVLRETYFKLPGSDEMTTLPEVLQKVTQSVAEMLREATRVIYEYTEEYYNYFIERISKIKVQMPVGDAISGAQLIEQVKANVRQVFEGVVAFVKNLEGLDTMLEKIGETSKAVVEKTQEFVDSIKSEHLDSVFRSANQLYREILTFIKKVVDQIQVFEREDVSKMLALVTDETIGAMDQVFLGFENVLQQTADELQPYVAVRDGKVEIGLPCNL